MNQKDIENILELLYRIRDNEPVSKEELDRIILELQMASIETEMDEYGEFD